MILDDRATLFKFFKNGLFFMFEPPKLPGSDFNITCPNEFRPGN